MTAFLAPELTSFALCWRVERRDGVAIGFTAHDRDLIVEGFRYRAAPGIVPSAIEEGDPLQADAIEIGGALTSEAIDADDLQAGRWDGAAVRLLAVDWSDPGQWVQLARGELGAVSIVDGRFTAELRGPGAALDRPVAEETSPMCRAELGDRRCRVDMAGRRQIIRLTSATGETLTLDRAEPVADGWGGGRLRWLDGANAGTAHQIIRSAGSAITLAEPTVFAAQPGDRAEISEGCDKRFATCRDRFANAANFRGEPHLPGIDLLTRYPGE